MRGKLVAITAAVIVLLLGAQIRSSAANNIDPGPAFDSPTISIAEPVDGTTLKVSRVAGAHAGLPDQWDMRYDAWFTNTSAAKYTVASVKIDHLNGSTVVRSITITPISLPIVDKGPFMSPAIIPAGQSNQLVMVRDDTLYSFPLPKSIRLTFTLKASGSSTTLTQEYPVAEHENPGPLNAYFFPVRQADLPKGTYFNQDRHEENNTYQRWAYDLGAEQWTGSDWSVTKLDKDGKPKDRKHRQNFLIYDLPVYAMSDGLVIGCNRGAPDDDPDDTTGNVPGGNLLWVRTLKETTLYAHLKQNSIPYSLCPHSDDKEHQVGDPNQDLPSNAQYRIHAGQLIGRTGSSGSSRGEPHFHFHTFMGLPASWGGSESGIDADARPLEFVNVRVQEKTAGNDVSKSQWNDIGRRRLLPYNTRVEPNDCGFDPSSFAGKSEVVNLAVPGHCSTEMYNAMVQAHFRPVYIDMHGTDSNVHSSSVWRPANGHEWAMYWGLDDSHYESERKHWVDDKGYRILQLEAYADGGNLKHAVIFVHGPGPDQLAQPNMTAATLDSVTKAQDKKGLVRVNVSAAAVDGVTKFDALFEKRNAGTVFAKKDIPIQDYQTVFNTQTKAGRTLVYIDGYEVEGKAFVSAIWYSNLTGSSEALHGQTKVQLAKVEGQNVVAGRFTLGLTEYTDGGTLVYAGLWR